MIPVVNERFEPPTGFRTSGGPGWKTEIIARDNGVETRNLLWARPLRRWQITGVPVTGEAARDLIRFFNARYGAGQGFLFRDPFGGSSAGSSGLITPFDQDIGRGDGEQMTFGLSLDDGAIARFPVTRPVLSSVRLALNGVETAAFSVNETTGEIVFNVPPPPDAVITAGFEFDLPVRFETDRLDLMQL